jgi:hypothetical protein
MKKQSMKKIALVYGLIAGGIMIAMFLITIPFQDSIGFDKGAVIGYSTMIIAFALIFFAIRNYRQNQGNGFISFGKAFGIGMLIVLVASVIYSLSWMLIQHFMMPDFYTKYAAYEKATMLASGASQQQMLEMQKSMDSMMSMLSNPVLEFLFTLIEPLPVGIVIALISSLILKKKNVVAVN